MGKLTDFVENYEHNNISRFHMPGHKGSCSELKKLGGSFDITEIRGADSLYAANGILLELEQRYSNLYQCETVLSAGGSTLAIQAMLALTSANGKVLAARNAHTSFMNSCILLNILPIWIYSDYSSETGLLSQPTPSQVEKALSENPDISSVYITSPDYMGIIAQVKEISEVCHAHNVALLVDSAHGAHLKFCPQDLFPISRGADFCCSSAHKTLPALTGGAFLHSNSCLKSQLKSAMKLFASTSPSYLILQSLDICADYLEQKGKQDFAELECEWSRISQGAKLQGINVYSDDSTKLTFDAMSIGLSGNELAEHFRANMIEPEYTSFRNVVLMLSPFLQDRDYHRLNNALCSLPKGAMYELEAFPNPHAERVLPPRQAAFSPWEKCGCETAVNRISAENIITCPPGIPIITTGERISKPIVNLLKINGIKYVKVVK